MHYHSPFHNFHPFQDHPLAPAMDLVNFILILLGALVALLLSPIHFE